MNSFERFLKCFGDDEVCCNLRISQPKRMKYKNIYVAATSQHVGKTTTTLGLASMFNKLGLKVGYCKPVGQKHITVGDKQVDKDTVLFADLLKFEVDPDIHSPVILGKGATKTLLSGTFNRSHFHDKIVAANTYLKENNDIVIYEGTGHPGVGSVGGASNATVAKLLDCAVVMVVEGGIGSTIDMLNMCMSLFREQEVPIMGVIVNKVIPDKIDMVKQYVGGWLKENDMKLLGVVPYDETLAYPLVWTVAKAIGGEIDCYPEKGYQKIEKVIAGSLADYDDFKGSENSLLVVGPRVIDQAIEKISRYQAYHNIEGSPLSGIVITGMDSIPKFSKKFIDKHKIPLIRTQLDTYGAVVKMSKIEVKINRRTPWKITKAIELIRENTNVKELVRLSKI